jgi:hypothetical protein
MIAIPVEYHNVSGRWKTILLLISPGALTTLASGTEWNWQYFEIRVNTDSIQSLAENRRLVWYQRCTNGGGAVTC